jgi:hypothetical protein
MSHNIVFIFTLRYIPRHFVVGATFQASSIVSAVKIPEISRAHIFHIKSFNLEHYFFLKVHILG